MEVKKSHKADLEHRRPLFFVASLLGVTFLFVGVLFIPFRSIGDMIDRAFEDYEMDFDIKDKDDMISAALPQEKQVEKQESSQLNKVDETTDVIEETPVSPPEGEQTEEQKTEEEPPINLNEDDEEILKVVEELPQYPGGMVEFMKWLTATLNYPDKALKQKIKGKVMVSFIVNKDGSISDIKLVKSVHKLLDDEALRVIKMMPDWKPGLEKGKPCRSMIAIPVVFEI